MATEQEGRLMTKGQWFAAIAAAVAVLVVAAALIAFATTHNINKRNRQSACAVAGGQLASPSNSIGQGCYRVTVQYEILTVEPWRRNE